MPKLRDQVTETQLPQANSAKATIPKAPVSPILARSQATVPLLDKKTSA